MWRPRTQKQDGVSSKSPLRTCTFRMATCMVICSEYVHACIYMCHDVVHMCVCVPGLKRLLQSILIRGNACHCVDPFLYEPNDHLVTICERKLYLAAVMICSAAIDIHAILHDDTVKVARPSLS